MMTPRNLLSLLALACAAAAQAQPAADTTPIAAQAPASSTTSRPTPYSPPMRVAPIGVVPGTTPGTPAAPPPPVAIQRPPTVGACDPGGCWDSNGNRLNRVGPNLMGPRGQCTTVYGIVNCP